MPIGTAQRVSKRLIAALVLPAHLQRQSSPVGGTTTIRDTLKELEKILGD